MTLNNNNINCNFPFLKCKKKQNKRNMLMSVFSFTKIENQVQKGQKGR